MADGVVLRGPEERDVRPLTDCVESTWDFGSFAGKRLGRRCSGLYLAECMRESTGCLVAECGGRTAGIITWRIANGETGKYRLGPSGTLSMKLTRQGRASLRFMYDYEHIFDELMNEKGLRYPAEITLFLVDEGFRGKGIGRLLFGSAVEDIRSNGCGGFFLRTDGDCDYMVYDRWGMTCRLSVSHLFQVGRVREDLELRLYDRFFDEDKTE